MLGSSLGAGGQAGGPNPLYQIRGPRSAQLALKLRGVENAQVDISVVETGWIPDRRPS